MELDFQNLFLTLPINGITINTVPLFPSFTVLVYSAAALVFAFTCIFFLSKHALPASIKKAVVVSFFSAGLLYAVHADIGWSTWLIHDSRTLAGLKTEEKLSRMEDGLYNFSVAARQVVDGDYALYSSDASLALRIEYFLLPLRKRDQARYLIVAADSQARYDPVSRTFTRGDVKVEQVEPVLVFARNAYILMRKQQ